MSGSEKDYRSLGQTVKEKPACLHRALQLYKEQEFTFRYVCGRCGQKFDVQAIAEMPLAKSEPKFQQGRLPWGWRDRQA